MIFRKCCQGSCPPPQIPDWIVGLMASVVAFFLGWFVLVVVKDLFM